jgi:hypothetical protein
MLLLLEARGDDVGTAVEATPPSANGQARWLLPGAAYISRARLRLLLTLLLTESTKKGGTEGGKVWVAWRRRIMVARLCMSSKSNCQVSIVVRRCKVDDAPLRPPPPPSPTPHSP